LHRFTRLATHAVVLAVAIGLASYSSVNRGLPSSLLRLGVSNAEARSFAQGGQVSDVSLGRAGVVLKPITLPVAVTVSHDPIHYTVQNGEDLKSVAAKFNVTVDELRWSNSTLGTSTRVMPGDKLLVPPIAGVVVQVHKGDTLANLAAVWHVDPTSIADFNYLRDPQNLVNGTWLVLPAGHGQSLTPVPYGPNLPAAVNNRTPFAIKVGGSLGPYTASFPYGQCTYYVATKLPVTWHGDAWTWYSNAQAAGWSAGSTPRVGAVMVTWESRYFGHVAYVESINPDGSWVVSEMNYVGWGVIDQRTIHPGQVPLIGFIYPL
jgi:surface antigen/LysM repeat protein